MINYLFLREARRRHARIASIAREHHDCVYSYRPTREICLKYIKTIRQRNLYSEKSELNSPRRTLIHLKCRAFKLNFPIFE